MRCRLPSIVLGVAFTLTLPSLAHAQATRTWVSGVGDDANPCSRTAPCKTFAGAISKTATGGEISVLDPGGYGAVTITKSITIDGGGIGGSIIASLVSGVIVNAASNSVVILRNLSINGVGNGIDGIRYLAAGALIVENVTIAGFTGQGIEVNATGFAHLTVKDTSIAGGATGVSLLSTTGVVRANLERVIVRGTTTGVLTQAGSTTVSNSVLAQNFHGAATDAGVMNLESTLLTGNTIGAQASNGSTIRLSNTAVYDNGQALNCLAGGAFATAGDNRFGGNGGGGCVPSGSITVQ